MIDYGVRAELLSLGAFASMVRFKFEGNMYEILAENDEFEHIGEECDDYDDED